MQNLEFINLVWATYAQHIPMSLTVGGKLSRNEKKKTKRGEASAQVEKRVNWDLLNPLIPHYLSLYHYFCCQ